MLTKNISQIVVAFKRLLHLLDGCRYDDFLHEAELIYYDNISFSDISGSIPEIVRIDSCAIYKIYIFWFFSERTRDFLELSNGYISAMSFPRDADDLRELYAVIYARKVVDSSVLSSNFIRDFRKLRESLEKAVDVLDARSFDTEFTSFNVSSVGSGNKILFCVDYLGMLEDDTITVFLKKRIELTLSAGFEVDVLFTKEKTVEKGLISLNSHPGKFKDAHNAIWIPLINKPPFYLWSKNSPQSIEKYLRLLKEISPDIVFFLGNGRSESPGIFAKLAYDYFPVGVLPYQVVQKPKNYLDGILTSNRYYSISAEESEMGAVFNFDAPLPKTGNNCDFNVSELPFSFGSFVLVTPLTGDRIVDILNKINSEFKRYLLMVFGENPNLVWLLVGPSDKGFNRLIEGNDFFRGIYEEGRFSSIPKTNKLRGLYRLSGAYFSPPGMIGGGRGASIAAYERLPVICEKNSDSSARSFEELMYSNPSEMYRVINLVLNDSAFMSEIVSKQERYIDQCTFDNAVNQFRAALFSIYRLGVRRLSKK